MSLEIDDNMDFPSVGDSDEAADALDDITEHILNESNKIVPLEEGTLMRSGVAQVDRNELVGRVSYDTVYAAYQHEKKDMSHNEGREAKYLERTIKRNKEEVLEYFKDNLGGMF